jgi:3-hydroxy acid dehydrogenase/malonic semialdehyde reductase
MTRAGSAGILFREAGFRMSDLSGRVVLVTGASSGIGAACAAAFARAGAKLLLAARRIERLEAAAPELRRLGAPDVRILGLDVRDAAAVSGAVASLPEEWKAVEILLNNAGLSRGLDKVHEGRIEDWDEMIDTNVKGLLYVDRAVVPLMAARGRGIVIHLGSISGRQVYPSGAVYCASKHAVRAITEGLRLDLLGTGVRVASVDPGLVETEFSLVRFRGDAPRAEAVYRDLEVLSAEDVADAVLYVATRPPHVQVSTLEILPRSQASTMHVHRDSAG